MASKDAFANMAVITLTESAANTLTYVKLETGIALFEKMAWLIHRLEFFFQGETAANLAADTDTCLWALCATNTLTTLASGNTILNPAVIYGQRIARLDTGVAANAHIRVNPSIIDFSTLPGGGILVPPNPLYAAIQGANAPNAFNAYLRIYYTNYTLSGADQYWELVESRRVISA